MILNPSESTNYSGRQFVPHPAREQYLSVLLVITKDLRSTRYDRYLFGPSISNA